MKFLFVGNNATANRGCEAILLSTIGLLEKEYPNSTYINCSSQDRRVKESAYLKLKGLKHRVHPEPESLEMLPWQFCKRLLGHEFVFERYVKQADYVFALGGDNYTLDYNNPEAFFKTNELVLKRNKPIVIWGASVGPFSARPDFESYAAAELKKVHKIVVRETETVNYLDSIGVSGNVVLRPDPAFFLEPRPCKLPEKAQKFLDQGCIGVNLSPLLGQYREGNWLQTAAEWVGELLKETELPILLIPHVMDSKGNDFLFLKEIMEVLASPERVALVPGNLSSQEYKYVISNLTVFAGARTHATIAALSSCVPTFSVGYSMKSQGINKDLFGGLEWVVDHRTLTASSFAGKIKELLTSKTSVRSHLQSIMPAYKRFPVDFL